MEKTITSDPKISLINKKWFVLLELIFIVSFVVFILSIQPIIVLIGWISLRLRNMSWKDIGLKKFYNYKSIVTYISVIVVIWLLVTYLVINPIVEYIFQVKLDLTVFAGINESFLTLILYLVVFAWSLGGFFEELMYRGYLQNRMVDLLGDTKIGWSISIIFFAFIFSLGHLYEGIVGIISVFLTSIVYSLIYLKFERNLWTSIFAHGLFNSLIFLSIYFLEPSLGIL